MSSKVDYTNVPTHNVVCSVCNTEKDYKSFTYYKTRFTSDGLRLRVNTNCKDCQRSLANDLNNVKKIAPNRPQTCDCCGKIPPNNRNWQLDHDHKAGKFAGWLCKDCNVGIGKLGDTASSVTKSWMYTMSTRSDVSKELIEEAQIFLDKLKETN